MSAESREYNSLFSKKNDFFTAYEAGTINNFLNEKKLYVTSPSDTEDAENALLYKYVHLRYEYIEEEYKRLAGMIAKEKDKNIKKRMQSDQLLDAIFLEHHAKFYGASNNKDNQERSAFLKLQENLPAQYKPEFSNNPLPLYKLRDLFIFFNLYRLFCVFSRLTWTQFYSLCCQNGWADELGNIQGVPVHLANFNLLVMACNATSVGFYAYIFIYNVWNIIKHTLIGTTEEERSVDRYDRFTFEIWKRHLRMGNDGVWGVINLLTNYANYFHYTAAWANKATAYALVFDIAWLIWSYVKDRGVIFRQRAMYEECGLISMSCDPLAIEQDRLIELTQNKPCYLLFNSKVYFVDEKLVPTELQLGPNDQEHNLSMFPAEQDTYILATQIQENTIRFFRPHTLDSLRQKHLDALDIQLRQLNYQYSFYLLSTVLYLSGFCVALLFSSLILATTGFMMCTFAMAILASAENFAGYAETVLFHYDEYSAKEQAEASYKFWFSMADNACMPFLLVGMYALHLPAALALTAVYLSVELAWKNGWKMTSDIDKINEALGIEEEDVNDHEPRIDEMRPSIFCCC